MATPSVHVAPALRPVIELDTPVPGVALRCSFDQRGMLYLALVHLASDAALTVSAHTTSSIRAAATHSLQCGSMVYLLAAGEAERFLTWLRNGGSTPTGVN
ncbi:hypothetical protein ABE571_04240 [Stenotrophomonas sp. TWI273]|uniref:hypothetical protein n=1 Tax=Stenotrophomonas sp. TWI273 TaxID=3136774 RepID=UPI00320B9BAD